jgi:general secretion pathway protein D
MGGGYGMGGMGGGYGGGMGMGMAGPSSGIIRLPGEVSVSPAVPQTTTPAPGSTGATDQTGQLLGAQQPAPGVPERGIRIVSDMINNLIVVQATQAEWDIINRTLQELDFPPRQVLIQAKVYEVSLTGGLSAGVQAFLARRGAAGTLAERKPTGRIGQATDVLPNLSLTFGALIGNTRELAVFLSGSQNEGRTRVLSAPSLIATDNIAATITVGQSVPTLASQALAGGAQADGNSLFTNTIANVQTGVTLGIRARVNASGIITMELNQEVSSPQAPSTSAAIQSPSIDRRSVRTQITIGDGDTVAIAGIIQETNFYSKDRVPFIGNIPVVGGLFGGTSMSKARTELVVLLTPRVIYDESEFITASEEIKVGLRSLRKMVP